MQARRRKSRGRDRATLLAAAKRVLPPQAIPFDADFFTDLGGHSLLAARFISVVRKRRRSRGLLARLYTARSLRAMAELLDRNGTCRRREIFPSSRRPCCAASSAAARRPWCFHILALVTAQWLGVFVSYMLLTGTDASFSRNQLAHRRLYVHQHRYRAIVIARNGW